MGKIKVIFAYAFAVDFLLKILIITAIGTLWRGDFTIHVEHSNLNSGYGGFEIKLKEPITIKPEIGGFEIKRPLTGRELIEQFSNPSN